MLIGGIIIIVLIIWFFPFIVEMLTRSDFSNEIHPGPKQPEEKKQKTYTLKEEKADWYTAQGRGMKEQQVGEKTFESSYIEVSRTERNPRLEKQEMRAIQSEGLDEIKAARVKVLWAQQMSTKKAAKEINERGYGYRTLDKYWAIFNQFHPE